MTKYTKPEINIEELDLADVIETSTEELEMWGSRLKTVDAEKINVFE